MTDRPTTTLNAFATFVVLAGLGFGLTSIPVMALEGDDKQPVLIEADKVEVDEGKSTSLYIGHVQVDQGSMRLLADRVTVHHYTDRRIKYIIARGEPAFYKQLLDDNQGEMQAFAKRMDFDAERDELILTGDALVIQGKDRIASDRIVYDRGNARVQAGDLSRVKITFNPDDNKSNAPQPGPVPPTKVPDTPPQVIKGRP
jgi:lipopolysaccharide export system protein LptA